MHSCSVRAFDDWRGAARPLLAAGVRADEIEWLEQNAPATAVRPAPNLAKDDDGASNLALRLPRRLLSLLECISHYRHAGRWELMYRLTWRTLNENRQLLEDEADADVRHATTWERAIHHDCHKMHAFVRFREARSDDGSTSYFAWFEPQHEILRCAVPFFTKRFPNMDWTIATPDGAAVWEQRALRFIDSPGKSAAPQIDSHEDLWRTYYRSICNVARVNPALMQREMPQRYWRHLPEAAEIPVLIRDGRERFAQRHSEVDDRELRIAKAVQRSLADLPAPAEGPAACRRCSLWQHATQAVIGEGPQHATLMLVGEQPGDEEDLRGRAFVGPAGKVLDAAIAAAGLSREELFITNAVKHFKWEPRGKRRLHRRPDVAEISACNVWLDREIATVQPRVLIALGATALRALTGLSDTIESARRQTLRHSTGPDIICTYHPSAILRADAGVAGTLRARLTADLTRARDLART